MSKYSRRDFMRAGVASAITPGVISALDSAAAFAAEPASPPTAAETAGAAALAPRERLLLDFGWLFHLGDACNQIKDFGLGSEMADEGGTFAKSGRLIIPGKMAGPPFQMPPPDASGIPAVLVTPGHPGPPPRAFNDAVARFFGPPKIAFDDAGWRHVDLPHDWAVDLPFVNNRELDSHGYKPLGRDFPETSIGWYRREFDVPSSETGRRLSIEFDGVFRNCMVLYNGFYLGTNFSGYAPFSFDITDFTRYGGKNELVVRVDATLSEGWFYEGAGIYRHVWLVKTDPVHVPQWGTYVRSDVRGGSATVRITTEVRNASAAAQTARVVSQIVDSAGNAAGSATSSDTPLDPWARRELEQQISLQNPSLWSLEHPNLYRLLTTIEVNGAAVDRYETPFGIRTLRFDHDQGFFLNGEPVKIKGTCNHQDHAGLGSALPDRVQSYRVERLKGMGSNGYRTSHNPPTPELLDACDRLGMLVMDETRMMLSSPEGLSQLERMVRRDRNHPSVVIWSLANEEPEQVTAPGSRIVSSMKRLVRRLDPTRPTTAAMNFGWGHGISFVIDVQGCNYNNGDIDPYHKKFQDKPMIGTETASTVSTRGIYINDYQKGYVSAYDVNYPLWAATAEQWWQVYAERPFLAGGFAWTGFDYRGEPTPYEWPCINSHFGIMDTCGFPKDNYFYYQAWWGSAPVLHVFPHWNWAGKAGEEIDVWVHSNLDRVELLVNGKSLGAQDVPRNAHVSWKAPYAPGFIEARGFKGGRQVLSAKRETTGPAARIVLRPDRSRIAADGEDVSLVAVEIQDAQGRVVPTAANTVAFSVSGSGELIGVGNGDPACHEADKGDSRSAFNGLCMAIVQAAKQAGDLTVEASSPGLDSGTATIACEPTQPRPAVA
jgi:beta-galactosidase